jgi:hypothetical protein
MVVEPSCLWTTEIPIRLASSPVTLLICSSLEFFLVALQVLSWRRTSVGPSAGQQALFSTKQGLHIILLITNAVHILLCALQLSGNTYAHSDHLRYVVLAYNASVLQLVLFRDIKTLERMALNKAVYLVRPLVKLLAGFTASYTLALVVLYACTNAHLPAPTNDGCSTMSNGGYVIISLILFVGILRVNHTMCRMQGKQIPDHPLIALSIKRLHVGLLVTNVLTWYFLISSVIFVVTHTALSIQLVSIAVIGFRLSSTFLCWYAWTPIRIGGVVALVGVMVIPSKPKEIPMEGDNQLSDTDEDFHLTSICASQRLASIREDGDRLEPELKRAKTQPPDAELLHDLEAMLLDVGWEPGLVADDTHKGHDQLQHHLLQRQHDNRKRKKQKVKQKEKQQRQLQEQIQQQKLQQQRLHLQPEDQQHRQHQQDQDHRQRQQQNQRREEQEHQQRPQRHQRREEQNLLQQRQQQEHEEHERRQFEHQRQQEKQHLEEHAMRQWPEVQAFLWQQRESRPPQEPQDTITIHIPSGAHRGQHPSITVTVPRRGFEAGITNPRSIDR